MTCRSIGERKYREFLKVIFSLPGHDKENCEAMSNHIITHSFSFLFLLHFLVDRMTHHFGSNCIATLDLHVESQERLPLTKTFTSHSILRHFPDKDGIIQYSSKQSTI